MENSEFLKTLLTNQQAIYSDFSTYALAIIGIIAGAQFLLNRYLSRRQISDAVTEHFKNLSSTIISENKKTFQKQLDSVTSAMKKQQDRTINQLEYESCRSLAMHAKRDGLKDTELRCWIMALAHAIKATSGVDIRTSIGAVVKIFDNPDKTWKTKNLKKYITKDIRTTLGKIPPTLHEEGDKIQELLKEIEKIVD